MSKVISIDELNEEMILAESVVNSFGQTLLNAGVCLEFRHKKLLKTWNIKFIKIIDDNEEINKNCINPEHIKIASEFINSRITWQATLPIEFDLINTAILIKATKFGDKNENN